MRPSVTGWTPSTRPASAAKTPPWWTYSGALTAPAPSQKTGSTAGTGPITVLTAMALLTGEDHQVLATASTLRWGLLLSEP